MNHEDAQMLKALLVEQRVLSLSVIIDQLPYASLIPYALKEDFSAVWIHASQLARHTAGLNDGAPFALVIHQPDHAQANPLQLPRVTIQGEVSQLTRNSQPYAAARERYIDKFPESTPIFSLGDFSLYELAFRRGRLVAGFARTVNLFTDTFAELPRLG